MITDLTILDHKQTIHMNVERMAVYLQSKIIEASDAKGQIFYLFFYKDQYLTTVTAMKLRKNSYIAHAFRDGIVLNTPHPLIQIFLKNYHQPFKKLTFDQFIKKAEKSLTPQETALVTTYFESFVPKRKIFEFIQTIFYEFRRNGQLLSCYRILRILMDFAPKQRWVRELSHDLNFIKYERIYKTISPELIKKDILYTEKRLYTERSNEEQFQCLLSLLQQQARWLDEIALWIQRALHTATNEDYSSLLHLLKVHFSHKEILGILEEMYKQKTQIPQIQNDLVQYYIELKQTEKLMSIIINNHVQLTSAQIEAIEGLLNEIDIESDHLNLEAVNKLAPFFAEHPQQAEKFLQRCISLLLNQHDVHYIQEWLLPFKKELGTTPMIKRLENMQQMVDDPDKQSQLGELYYQFKQFDKAIDCFSWEMELKGNDPTPVKWLSKIYSEMGLKAEYKAYQNLYIDMQKRA